MQLIYPLYIYPRNQAEAWLPLVEAIQSHPQLQFILIINPNNGPGDTLDANYQRGIERIRAPNVQCLGYVSTQYGKRDQGQVRADIEAYKGWPGRYGSAFRMDGVFLDEGRYEEAGLEYYRTACHGVKSKGASPKSSSKGLNWLKRGKDKRTSSSSSETEENATQIGSRVVLNPGCPCHQDYYAMADQVVWYEGAVGQVYDTIQLPTNPSKTSMMLHSVPAEGVTGYIERLKQAGNKSLFITDLKLGKENVYAAFPRCWDQILATMDSKS